jgi:uncharacterized phage protein gp47/JayE
MPFARPTLQALIERTQADLEAHLPSTDARLRRSNVHVLARVNAGGQHGVYGYLDFLARQLQAATAEGAYLEHRAAPYGLARKAAVPAAGDLVATGTDTTAIPLGTVWQRSDGARFASTAAAEIGDPTPGEATVPVEAEEPGLAGNTAAGSTLSLVSPIAGVDSGATVDVGGLTGGFDSETDDELRARLFQRLQNPPAGGADHDYERWALEVAGVTRAWVQPLWLGGGTVGLFLAADNAPGGPIPDQALVDDVQAYIEDGRAPVTATVYVMAPVAAALALTLEITPDTQALRDAVEAELADLLLDEVAPGETLYLAQLHRAIAAVEGWTNYTIVAPAADVVHDPNELPTLGVVTWQ